MTSYRSSVDGSPDLPSGPTRLVAMNSIFLLGTYCIRFATGLALTVFLVRMLGPSAFGSYAFAIAVGTQLLFLGDLGLSLYIRREVSRSLHESQPLFRRSLGLSVSSTLVAVAVATIGAVLLGRTADAGAIALATLYVGMSAWITLETAVLHAQERMASETAFTVVERVLGLVAAVTAVLIGGRITGVLVALVAARLLALAWLHTKYLRRWLATQVEGVVRTPRIMQLVYISWPFALNILATSVYQRIDVVILSLAHGDLPTGLYTAATAITVPLGVVAAAISTSSFPRLSRAYVRQEQNEFTQLLQQALELVIVVALPIAMGLYMLASSLTQILYGGNFSQTVSALQVLAFSIPIVFVNNIVGTGLTAANRQRDRAMGVTTAAVFNLVAASVLIPIYSVVGAAVATLLTELAIFAVLVSRLPHGWGPQPASPRLFRAMIAGTIAVFSAVVPPGLGAIAATLLAMAVYCAGILLLRVYRLESLFALLGRETRDEDRHA